MPQSPFGGGRQNRTKYHNLNLKAVRDMHVVEIKDGPNATKRFTEREICQALPTGIFHLDKVEEHFEGSAELVKYAVTDYQGVDVITYDFFGTHYLDRKPDGKIDYKGRKHKFRYNGDLRTQLGGFLSFIEHKEINSNGKRYDFIEFTVDSDGERFVVSLPFTKSTNSMKDKVSPEVVNLFRSLLSFEELGYLIMRPAKKVTRMVNIEGGWKYVNKELKEQLGGQWDADKAKEVFGITDEDIRENQEADIKIACVPYEMAKGKTMDEIIAIAEGPNGLFLRDFTGDYKIPMGLFKTLPNKVISDEEGDKKFSKKYIKAFIEPYVSTDEDGNETNMPALITLIKEKIKSFNELVKQSTQLPQEAESPSEEPTDSYENSVVAQMGQSADEAEEDDLPF